MQASGTKGARCTQKCFIEVKASVKNAFYVNEDHFSHHVLWQILDTFEHLFLTEKNSYIDAHVCLFMARYATAVPRGGGFSNLGGRQNITDNLAA